MKMAHIFRWLKILQNEQQHLYYSWKLFMPYFSAVRECEEWEDGRADCDEAGHPVECVAAEVSAVFWYRYYHSNLTYILVTCVTIQVLGISWPYIKIQIQRQIDFCYRQLFQRMLCRIITRYVLQILKRLLHNFASVHICHTFSKILFCNLQVTAEESGWLRD